MSAETVHEDHVKFGVCRVGHLLSWCNTCDAVCCACLDAECGCCEERALGEEE